MTKWEKHFWDTRVQLQRPSSKTIRLVLDNVFPTTTNHFHPKMRRIFRIQQCGRTFHGICKFGNILYAPFGFKVAALMQMTQDLIIVTGLLAKVDSNRDSSSLLDYIIWWMWDNICYKFRCNSRNWSFQLKKNKGTSGIRRTPECWPISIRKPSESIIDDKPLIYDVKGLT